MKLYGSAILILACIVIALFNCSKQEEQINAPDPNITVISVGEKIHSVAELLTAVQEEIDFNVIRSSKAQKDTESNSALNTVEIPTVKELLKKTGDKLAFHSFYAQKAQELNLDQSDRYKEYEQDIVRNELYEKLLIEEILSHISFTDKDLLDYYERNINKLKIKNSDRFIVSGMYVKLDDKPADEAWKIIQEAYEKLEEGKDFDAVSIQYSEAPFETRGLSQEFNVEDFNNNEIPQILAKLVDGEYSEIIPSSNKLLIYKRHQYIPPSYSPFNTNKVLVNEMATIEKRDSELVLMNQELMEKYQVSMFPDLLLESGNQNHEVNILSLPEVFEMTLGDFLKAAEKEKKNSYQEKLNLLNIVVNKTLMLAEANSRGWHEETVSPIVKYYTNKWLTEEYIRHLIQDKMITDEQCRQSYLQNKNHKNFRIQKKYDLYYLYFPAVYSLEQTLLETENSFLRAQQKAQQAYNELKNGSDFFDIVSKYSHDAFHRKSNGHLGKIALNQLTPQRFDAIRNENLQVGEFSEPHEVYQHKTSRYGYEIYYVDDIEPERQMTFPEAKELLKRVAEQKLYGEQYKKLLDEWETEHTLQYHTTVLEQVIDFLADIADRPDIRQTAIYRYTEPKTEIDS